MSIENKKIEKLCGFYVSDWHLVTMLLPYINNKIEKNAKVVTILEKEIKEKITTLLDKLNLKNKNEILNIDWDVINSKKYTNISRKLKEHTQKNTENLILINGCKDYIEKNNKNVKMWIKNTNIQNIKIINFFEVTEFNNNIMEILDSHDKILNTSGEKQIEEVFEGYNRTERIKKYS